eukprot:954944-Pelagomonas_calceolata.AAC.8
MSWLPNTTARGTPEKLSKKFLCEQEHGDGTNTNQACQRELRKAAFADYSSFSTSRPDWCVNFLVSSSWLLHSVKHDMISAIYFKAIVESMALTISFG